VPPRIFTQDEARALLPDVRRHAEQLVTATATGNGHGLDGELLATLREEVERAERELAGALTALQELGVVVKDLDAGLVDFPSLRDGEEVYLCWQLGEDDVTWWHGLEEGFRGRKPI
jgi:hypothetical protein